MGLILEPVVLLSYLVLLSTFILLIDVASSDFASHIHHVSG